MSKRLEVPAELEFLIEKRELNDRRKAERRNNSEDEPAATAETVDSDTAEQSLVTENGEVLQQDRRTGNDRRLHDRRDTDRNA